jgi:Uncharacterized conserved protein
MSPRDVRAYLFDIAEACDLVLAFTKSKTVSDYAADPMLRSAVERQLEIAGEALAQALRHHPDLLTDQIPEAPRIIAFRNQLAHGYSSIVDDIVWAIVERDVPALRDRITALLAILDDRQANP